MQKHIAHWPDKKSPHLRAVNLELTSHCNYKCTFCLNPEESFRKKGHISIKLVDKVLNELEEEVAVHLCGIGEPSLHPDFIDILQKVANKFKNISIVTNGHLFRNEALIKAVLDANVGKINLSLDYLDRTRYRDVKGGDLDQLLTHLKLFIQTRENHRNKPLLQINYLYEKTKHDYVEVYNYFQTLLDERWCMYIRKIKDLSGQVAIDVENDEEVLDLLFGHLASDTLVLENWHRYLANVGATINTSKICRHIYDYYMLLWNGDIVPCCNDFNGKLKICNVLEENLHLTEVFYSEKYNNFRSKMEMVDYDDFPICRNCNDYYRA